jgi:hypothetical protein
MSNALKFVCWLGGGITTILAAILVGPRDTLGCLTHSTSLLPFAADPCLSWFGFKSSAALQTEVAGGLAVLFFVLPFILDLGRKES